MTNTRKQILINEMESILMVSQKMWDNKTAHATIIGYLTGTLKYIKAELEHNPKSNK